MMRILDETGFVAQAPAGAYYVMADISHLGFDDDVTAATSLVEKIGVATVPGSSFFSDPVNGRHLLRFAFCKKLETLEERRTPPLARLRSGATIPVPRSMER